MRFSGVEILFGLFAAFIIGFTTGMVAEHLVAVNTAAMCQEGP